MSVVDIYCLLDIIEVSLRIDTHQTRNKKKTKYSIANYISTQRLSEPLKAFAYKLSTEYIPSTVEEAFTDPQ